MCSGVGLVLSCVFVLLCIFRDLSLSLLNIMKRSSPASFEIDIISLIPLTTRRQEYFWAWHYEKRIFHGVRSAYRMLVINREKNSAWLEDRPSKSD